MSIEGVADAASTMVTGADLPGPAIAHLAAMPRVDLMPPEIGERSALRRLQGGCAAALVLSIAAVGGLYYQAHGQVQDRRSDVTAAQATQRSVQSQVSDLASVATTYASMLSAQDLVSQALGGEVLWSNQLAALSTTVTPGVWFTNMTVTPSTATNTTTNTTTAANGSAGTTPPIATISFQGVASNRNQVAAWLNDVEKIKGYVGSTYSTTTEVALGGQKVVNFTSTVNLTADVLSNRFTNKSGD